MSFKITIDHLYTAEYQIKFKKKIEAKIILQFQKEGEKSLIENFLQCMLYRSSSSSSS